MPAFPITGWRAFLANQLQHTASVDFFIVVTVGFRLLYGMVILSLNRRRIIHYAVTAHPKQEWVADQLRHCFTHYPKPKFLIRDRDSIYGQVVTEFLKGCNIEEKIVSRAWQNGHVESLIRSIRMECLDHVIIYNEKHLQRILASYVSYYNYSRLHLSLYGDAPIHRPVERAVKGNRIIAIPQVGGLHHRYERRAA